MDDTKQNQIFDLVAAIPRGKVLTYKRVAELTSIKNPRLVGRYLHSNTDSDKVPCHRVIRSDGTVASGYAFGGPGAQLKILEAEGVKFIGVKTNLDKFMWDFQSS